MFTTTDDGFKDETDSTLKKAKADPAYAGLVAERMKLVCESIVARLLAADPEDEGELGYAAGLMHRLFVCRDHGIDSDWLRRVGHQLYDHFGHELIHQLDHAAEHAMKGGRAVHVLMDTLNAVNKTLDSPIDDADKISHLKELLRTGSQGEALAKWNQGAHLVRGKI